METKLFGNFGDLATRKEIPFISIIKPIKLTNETKVIKVNHIVFTDCYDSLTGSNSGGNGLFYENMNVFWD